MSEDEILEDFRAVLKEAITPLSDQMDVLTAKVDTLGSELADVARIVRSLVPEPDPRAVCLCGTGEPHYTDGTPVRT